MKIFIYISLFVLVVVSMIYFPVKNNVTKKSKELISVKAETVIKKEGVTSTNNNPRKEVTKKSSVEVNEEKKQVNFSDHLGNLDERIRDYMDLPERSLNIIVAGAAKKIIRDQLIELSNAANLSEKKLRELATLLQMEEAAKLALLEKELTKLEEEFL